MIPDYDYDQYTKNKLHDDNRQLYFDNKQLYEKNMGLFSQNEWLKEECRRFEREIIQLRSANEQLYIDNERLQTEKVDDESVKRKLISDNSYLQYCLRDRDNTIRNLEKLNQSVVDKKDRIVRFLRNENVQLGQELDERSEEHLEQTNSLQAKIDEKDDIIQNLQEEIEEYSKLEDTITGKEKIIENLQKTLDEQFSAAEIQSEQNAIFRREYEDSQSELARCSFENRNLRQSFEDGGAWVRKKQEEIATMEADMKRKEDDLTDLAKLFKESEEKLREVERETQEKISCKLCMEDDISVVFLPCGHLCCCSSCANLPAVKNCPICREEIGSKIRVFQS